MWKSIPTPEEILSQKQSWVKEITDLEAFELSGGSFGHKALAVFISNARTSNDDLQKSVKSALSRNQSVSDNMKKYVIIYSCINELCWNFLKELPDRKPENNYGIEREFTPDEYKKFTKRAKLYATLIEDLAHLNVSLIAQDDLAQNILDIFLQEKYTSITMPRQEDIPVPKQEEIPVPKQEEVPVPKQEVPVPKQEVPVPKQEVPVLKQEIPVPRQEVPVPRQEVPVPKREDVPTFLQKLLISMAAAFKSVGWAKIGKWCEDRIELGLKVSNDQPPSRKGKRP